MSPEERQLLSDLFDRVRSQANAPRDRDAENLIAEAVRAQPYAPYLLAQAVLVQEQALHGADQRIQELQAAYRPARGAGPVRAAGRGQLSRWPVRRRRPASGQILLRIPMPTHGAARRSSRPMRRRRRRLSPPLRPGVRRSSRKAEAF